MKESGAALIVAAFIILLVALGMDVTVRTPSIPVSYGSGVYTPSIPSQEVVNLQALHNQSLVVHGAFVAFLAGVLLVGLGFAADRLHGQPEASNKTAADGEASFASGGEGDQSSTATASPSPPAYADPGPITPREWAMLGGGIVILLVIVIAMVVLSKPDPSSSGFGTNLGATNGLTDAEINRILDEANETIRNAEEDIGR